MSKPAISVEFLNPFVSATFSVLNMVLGTEAQKGNIFATITNLSTHQITIVMGVVGDVTGNVTIAMSRATADKIASAMMGSEIKTFDEMAESAVTELGNMISGNGLTALEGLGYVCNMVPPAVVKGVQIQISPVAQPTIFVPLELGMGQVFLGLGLQGAKKAAPMEQAQAA